MPAGRCELGSARRAIVSAWPLKYRAGQVYCRLTSNKRLQQLNHLMGFASYV